MNFFCQLVFIFRQIMANRSVVILDAFVAIMAGYFGALALALFYLSFQSVLAQWDAFKRGKFDTVVGKNTITVIDITNFLNSSFLIYAIT